MSILILPDDLAPDDDLGWGELLDPDYASDNRRFERCWYDD